MASRLHDPPLMHRQGAEITSAKAAPVAHQTELYLCNRRNAARRIVHRMPSPAVWKRVDIIHLLPRQRFCRWILHDIDRAIRLHETFSGKWIRIFVLNRKTLRIGLFVFPDFFIGRKQYIIIHRLQILRLIACSIHERDILYVNSRCQCIRNLHDRVFAHPIRNQIRSSVHQNGAFHTI